jgi:DNA ligase D-like protein (predicted 3'-phosphoesterase)
MEREELQAYLARRKDINAGVDSERPMFVIHRRDGDTIDYHVRLEVGTALKSWRIETIPSLNPAAKRSAEPVEDVDLPGADFEGVVDRAAIMLWDAGWYRNLREEYAGDPEGMSKAIGEGKVEVWLEGRKLQGGFRLHRTGQDTAWVFAKLGDEGADLETTAEDDKVIPDADRSALTGRTMDEILASSDRTPSEALRRGAVGPDGERSLGDRGEEGSAGEMPIGRKHDGPEPGPRR